MLISDNTKFPRKPEKILHQTFGQMKKYCTYKDECKQWIDKDEAKNKWDNLKTHFVEAHFELNEDNELNKKHVRFLVDETSITDKPNVQEAQMTDALNNLANEVTSDATNITNITTVNDKLTERLKVSLSQKNAH